MNILETTGKRKEKKFKSYQLEIATIKTEVCAFLFISFLSISLSPKKKCVCVLFYLRRPHSTYGKSLPHMYLSTVPVDAVSSL